VTWLGTDLNFAFQIPHSALELAERVRIEPAPLAARICVHRDFIRMNRGDAARRPVLRQITIHARNGRIRQFFVRNCHREKGGGGGELHVAQATRRWIRARKILRKSDSGVLAGHGITIHLAAHGRTVALQFIHGRSDSLWLQRGIQPLQRRAQWRRKHNFTRRLATKRAVRIKDFLQRRNRLPTKLREQPDGGLLDKLVFAVGA